jgi:hypothetical protein
MTVSLVDCPQAGVIWEPMTAFESGEESFNAPTSELAWLVTGTFDPDAFLVGEPGNNVPMLYTRAGVPRMIKGLKWDPTSPTLGNSWIVKASYAWAPEYVELSFDTSGGTAKRDQAYDVGDYYSCQGALTGPVTPGQVITGSTATVPNFKGIIPDGCDVPDDKFDFTVLIRNKFSTLPNNYITTIGDLSGHTNDRPLTLLYKGQVIPFDKEELLFHGMPGKISNDDGYEITLKFSKQKSKAGGAVVTQSFVQPNIGDEVVIFVGSTVMMPALHSTLYIQNGGLYELIAINALGHTPPDNITIRNLGSAGNAAEGATVTVNSNLSVDSFDQDPLVIGGSGPIKKAGWRFLKVIGKDVIIGGQKIAQPQYVLINKVIPTADFSPIGIFS